MEDDRSSAFGGVSGRVLAEAMSASCLISGIGLGVCVAVLAGFAALVEAPAFVSLLAQVLMAVALARFATNGMAGEWRGTIFSGHGGSWFEVARVALRYLTLTALWSVPLALFGKHALSGALASDSLLPFASAGLLAVGGLWLFASAVTPPLFLVVSVRADRLADVFSRSHWGDAFRGRSGDLLAVYATYLGGLGVGVGLSLPVVALAGLLSSKLAVVTALGAGAFLFGLAVTLIGRLCGFFAAGDAGLIEPAVEASGLSPLPQLAPGLRPPRAAAPAPAAPRPDRRERDAAAGGATAHANPDGKVVFLQGAERAAEALKRFETDPRGAVSLLEETRASYLPNPQVLHALALMHKRRGDTEASLGVALEAVPLCLERGHIRLVADLYRALHAHVSRFALTRDQVCQVGMALREMGDWKYAANAYASVLQEDPRDRRAYKWMLQVADFMLRQQSDPQAASRVYTFLLERDAQCPLAEFAREGLADAARRMAAGVH